MAIGPDIPPQAGSVALVAAPHAISPLVEALEQELTDLRAGELDELMALRLGRLIESGSTREALGAQAALERLLARLRTPTDPAGDDTNDAEPFGSSAPVMVDPATGTSSLATPADYAALEVS